MTLIETRRIIIFTLVILSLLLLGFDHIKLKDNDTLFNYALQDTTISPGESFTSNMIPTDGFSAVYFLYSYDRYTSISLTVYWYDYDDNYITEEGIIRSVNVKAPKMRVKVDNTSDVELVVGVTYYLTK